MATCKDCIHNKICGHYVKSLSKSKGIDFDNAIEQYCEISECDNCEYFQNRSKFIELPCELGDRLYAINGKGEIKSWKIICIRAIKSSIQWNPEHIEYTVGCEKSNGIMWIHLDKTKNVYFSFEEAEQALRERDSE